jgi:hydrogenase maturation protease
VLDAHGMEPDVVLGLLDLLGGDRPGRITVVGCEPASVSEGMGLSEPVAASLDEAVRIVLRLAAGETAAGPEHAAPEARRRLYQRGSHVPRHTR